MAEEILANFQRAPVDLGTSILADRQADRPMEWDIRNGVIQRYGRRHGIAVPVSDVVVPLLAAGSEGRGEPGLAKGKDPAVVRRVTLYLP